MECPHCGGIIDAGAPRPLQHPVFDDDRRCLVINGEVRRVSGAQWRMLLALRERFERCVRDPFLAEVSARRPEDGGSEASVPVIIVRLRRGLRGSPFAIANFHGQGHGLFWAKDVEVRIMRNGLRRTRLLQTRR